jgi:hypothetical protein
MGKSLTYWEYDKLIESEPTGAIIYYFFEVRKILFLS